VILLSLQALTANGMIPHPPAAAPLTPQSSKPATSCKHHKAQNPQLPANSKSDWVAQNLHVGSCSLCEIGGIWVCVLPASLGNASKPHGTETTTLLQFQDLQTLPTSLGQSLDVSIRDGHPLEPEL